MNQNEKIDSLVNIYWGWHISVRNWLQKPEVIHGVTILTLLVGAFALKFNSDFWKWAYLLCAGLIAVPWMVCRFWQLIKLIIYRIRR